MSSTFKKIWNLITTLLVIAVVLMAVLLVGVRVAGLRVYAVLSGSMEPAASIAAVRQSIASA